MNQLLLEDIIKRPLGMSNSDWRRLRTSFREGRPISGVEKPFVMGDEMWEQFQQTYESGLQANLSGDVSGIESVQDQGPLKSFLGPANPALSGGLLSTALGAGGLYLASRLHEEQSRPKDADIENFTVSASIIPNYKTGGRTSLELAQTEEGEIYVQEDGTISDVKSKSTHKEMRKDEKKGRGKIVTDIFSEGGYVFSDNVKIKKKDADIIFGYSQPLYEEEENDSEVEEINFIDLFKEDEKELGSAELAKRIREKFKITDEDKVLGNPLVKKSNEENRESRFMWLEALVDLTEGAKPASQRDSVNEMVKDYKYGGRTARTPKGVQPKKYQTSNPTLTDIISRNYRDTLRQRRDFRDLYSRNLQDLRGAYAGQRRALGLGTIAGIGSMLAQDPSETAPDLTATIGSMRRQHDRILNYLRDQASRRLSASTGQAYRALGEAAPDYATFAAGAANLHSNELAQQSDLAASQNLASVQMRNEYLRSMGDVYAQDAQARAATENARRSNLNALIANIGGLATNYLNKVSALRGDRFSTEMALQGQGMAMESALQNNLNQSTLLGAYYGIDFGQPSAFNSVGINPMGSPFEQERLERARESVRSSIGPRPIVPPTTDSRPGDFDILFPRTNPFRLDFNRNHRRV